LVKLDWKCVSENKSVHLCREKTTHEVKKTTEVVKNPGS
jgi:hypothetical protein